MKKIFTLLFTAMILLSVVFTTNTAEAKSNFSFKQLKGETFYFSSGVGAWSTELTMAADGTFQGEYSDSDAGDGGKGYTGTVYLCKFSGKFTNLKKISKYVYSMELKQLKYPKNKKAQIKKKVRYVYTDPYGLEEGKLFYLYLPGMKVKDLPESFRDWTHLLSSDAPKKLKFYGLYNVTKEYGFS